MKKRLLLQTVKNIVSTMDEIISKTLFQVVSSGISCSNWRRRRERSQGFGMINNISGKARTMIKIRNLSNVNRVNYKNKMKMSNCLKPCLSEHRQCRTVRKISTILLSAIVSIIVTGELPICQARRILNRVKNWMKSKMDQCCRWNNLNWKTNY